jgi:ABC-type Fe3+/spermidine/putrescine transport system ATPase subunit
MDRPNEVYERPTSQFVADFMGSTNLINGVLRISVSGPVAELVDTDLGPLRCSFASPFAAGTKVSISVRPENIKIAAETIFNGDNVLEGRIKDQSVCLGVADYSIDVRGIELRVRSAVNGKTFSDSETVKLQVTPDKCVVVSTDKGDQRYETAATD